MLHKHLHIEVHSRLKLLSVARVQQHNDEILHPVTDFTHCFLMHIPTLFPRPWNAPIGTRSSESPILCHQRSTCQKSIGNDLLYNVQSQSKITCPCNLFLTSAIFGNVWLAHRWRPCPKFSQSVPHSCTRQFCDNAFAQCSDTNFAEDHLCNKVEYIVGSTERLLSLTCY